MLLKHLNKKKGEKNTRLDKNDSKVLRVFFVITEACINFKTIQSKMDIFVLLNPCVVLLLRHGSRETKVSGLFGECTTVLIIRREDIDFFDKIY